MQKFIITWKVIFKALLIMVLCVVSVGAMEMVPYCQEPLSFTLLSQDMQAEIGKKFFICTLGTSMIDESTIKSRPLNIPLFLIVKLTKEFAYLQEVCREPIANQQVLPLNLFRLSQEEKDVFFRIKDRSIFLSGDIDERDYEILEKRKDKDLFKGFKLTVNYADKRIEFASNFFRILFFLIMLKITIIKGPDYFNTKDLIICGSYGLSEIFFSILHFFCNPRYAYGEDKCWYHKKIQL